MLIINQNRRRQIGNFIDSSHEVSQKYYDYIIEIEDKNILLDKMYSLIEEDDSFLDPYLIISDILYDKKDYKGYEEKIREAYIRAIITISDSKGRWPKSMDWGYIENRHIMRSIEQYGLYLWENGANEYALEIFKNLLNVNPGDNQGVRYNILAIRMKKSFHSWEKPFLYEKDGEIIGLDAFKLSKWFDRNHKKFLSDFKKMLDFFDNC